MAIATLALPGAAAAAPADLDPAFGAGGVATYSVTSGNDELHDIALQPDGKIVAVGKSIVANRDFALMRLNRDGSLDATFSGDGLLTLDVVGGRHDDVNAVTVQPDGKILAAGSVEFGPGSATMFSVIRLNDDGSYDTSFGSGHNGRAYVTYSGSTSITQAATSVAVQPDGRIVLGGYTDAAGSQDFALARLNSDGTLDTTFSGDGRVSHWIGANSDRLNDIAIQPDGKIVAAGSTEGVFTDYDFVVARYNVDGSLDPTFNETGFRVTPASPGADYGKAVAVQPDGKIVLSGDTADGTVDDAMLVRYTVDGQKDASFGVGGMAKTALSPFSTSAEDVALQNNGKIVVVGQYYLGSPPTQDFFVAQYDGHGALDPSFDGDGVLTRALSANGDFATAVAVQPDGRIVAGGWADAGVDYEFTLIRLEGELPLAPVAAPSPVAKITVPAKSKIAAGKLRAFRGTAGPAGQVAQVEIALRRIDRRLLRRGRCQWLKSAKSAFVRTKARKHKCESRRFLKAAGGETWSFRLKNSLPKGSYELYVRVTLKSGEANTTFTRRAGNLKVFRAV